MDRQDQGSGSHRISDVMLDAMLAGTDAATVFHSGELLSELRQRLAERILDAEMEVHLDPVISSEFLTDCFNRIFGCFRPMFFANFCHFPGCINWGTSSNWSGKI